MEYQNIDEVARHEACQRVKQIVKAIKAIKIKYYLNFSKISAKDKEMYQKLETSLEKISYSNNLKVALMQEVELKYSGKDVKDMGTGEQKPNEFLQACYGAIDAEKEALSKGKITQAIRCQEQLKKYIQQLDEESRNEVINYKREKFAELMQTRQQLEEQIETWNSLMKGFYKIEDVHKRKNTNDMIQDLQTNVAQIVKNA